MSHEQEGLSSILGETLARANQPAVACPAHGDPPTGLPLPSRAMHAATRRCSRCTAAGSSTFGRSCLGRRRWAAAATWRRGCMGPTCMAASCAWHTQQARACHQAAMQVQKLRRLGEREARKCRFSVACTTKACTPPCIHCSCLPPTPALSPAALQTGDTRGCEASWCGRRPTRCSLWRQTAGCSRCPSR